MIGRNWAGRGVIRDRLMSGHAAGRRAVLEYAELNWRISMIVSVSALPISRDHALAVETLN